MDDCNINFVNVGHLPSSLEGNRVFNYLCQMERRLILLYSKLPLMMVLNETEIGGM